ncbi:hypothetical protein N0V82_005779 [Gnomoniopsis sp. IMI 355080]|nr:hypothetical protein N0V82_005779 [Gnomoniopsis sp. IMI 355080]
MLVSMMERADRAGVIKTSLLINHRAYGGLHKLASEMFYAKKMISGHKSEETFPPSVRHLQRYLERFLPPGQNCHEPRLIAFNGKRGEVRVGTSWYNQSHISWVMERIMELLPDPMFRQVDKNERGTILIISPYKESYMRYKKAIKELPTPWQARLNVEGRVEARTIDTVQGGEADFVFLDMVRSESTDFTDDPNRLNVAITRARQAEVIMMHPGMRRSARFLAGIFGHCNSMGQVVDMSIDGQPKEMTQEPNEERAYDEHVEHQRQLDQKRVAHGLEPVAARALSGSPVRGTADDIASLSDEDDGPQSIYTEKFASLGLADFMQSILNENKAERETERQTPGQTQPAANGAARGRVLSGPSKIDNQTGPQNGVYAPAQTHRHMPSQISQNGNGIPPQFGAVDRVIGPAGVESSSTSSLANSLSRPSINEAPKNCSAEIGLAQSRRNVMPGNPEKTSHLSARGQAEEIKKEKKPLPSGSNWW